MFVCENNDLSLGFFIHITPIYGNKRQIQINRTKIRINSHQNPFLHWSGSELVLPSIDCSFNFEINLIKEIQKPNTYKVIVKSQDENMINVSGILLKEGRLVGGEVIKVGGNILAFEFKSQDQMKHSDFINQITLDRNMIRSEMPVLIHGETGTGKTTIAKRVHENSTRKGRFVHLNLAAIPEGLIESELFGHCKGAFTGATSDRRGAVESAKDGTLFLDEIDSIPLHIQTKLLLFLDNKKFRPVGQDWEKEASCRLIFASGSDLAKRAREGRFRFDLYQRLNWGYRIKLNSLSEDKDLKKMAIDFFCRKENSVLAPELFKLYMQATWSGNFRQMEGHFRRKSSNCRGNYWSIDELDRELLSDAVFEEDEVLSLEDVKRSYIRKAFAALDCNNKLTIEKLKISSGTLRKYIGV